MSIDNSKQTLTNTCNALIEGVMALPGGNSVVAAGVTYTKAQLLAPLKTYAALPAVTAAAKTAYVKAIAEEKAAKEAALERIRDVVKPFLQGRVGRGSADLVTYGLQPARVAQVKTATRAAAAEKALATRRALGTMGTDQKKRAKKALAAAATTPSAEPPTAPPTSGAAAPSVVAPAVAPAASVTMAPKA